MVCGGVEKELITILNRFDRKKYALSLLLMYDAGDEIMSQIPTDVKLINLSVNKRFYFSNLWHYLYSRAKAGNFGQVISGLFKGVLLRHPAPVFVDLSDVPSPEQNYDIAVCYHMHSPICLRYVVEKISAGRYISWIHNDFSTTGFKIGSYKRWLNKYDLFACVSNRLRDEFLDIFPEFASRTIIAHNIVDRDEIVSKMNESSDEICELKDDPTFKILTVGRFVEQKGFDIAIKTCAILIKKGYDIKWYAIGYGKDIQMMRSLVCQYKLGRNFIILGRRDNPYPYMKLADLYVQPSRHEGFGITVEEVKVVGTYIIATDFAGVREQLLEESTGVVVDSFEPDDLAERIIYFIDNPPTREKGVLNNNSDWTTIESLFL